MAWSAEDHRSHRSKNSEYVRRKAPSTTPSRSPYSFLVRRANSSGVSGVSMPVLLSRIEHQGKVCSLDAADECTVCVRLELDGSFVDEGVDVVDGPVAVALDAQAIPKAFVFYSSREQIGGAGVD